MNENTATIIWKQFEQGIQYLKNSGLWDEWDECERFMEGNQWAAPTQRTRALPRPVVNLSAMIAENKKSNILSSNILIMVEHIGFEPMTSTLQG